MHTIYKRVKVDNSLIIKKMSNKKSNKRLYFLILLKGADSSRKDIINFYCTVIRPVLQYCSPIFHHSLPEYPSKDLECVQKRALSITSPEQSHSQCLDSFGLSILRDRLGYSIVSPLTNTA